MVGVDGGFERSVYDWDMVSQSPFAVRSGRAVLQGMKETGIVRI